MNDYYIVDTHVLLWYLDADRRLSLMAKQILDDPDVRLLLPAIALAEALFILERKQRLYRLSEDELLQRVRQDFRMEVAAFDEEALVKTLDCKAIDEMHDRQIVATALLAQDAGFDVAVLTRDEHITASRLVQTVW